MSASSYAPKLFVSQIQDTYLRKNFELLDAYFKAQNQLLNFKFFEVNTTKAETGFILAHGLGFKPLDIIVSHFSGAATKVTFRYDLPEFDETNVVLDVDGAATVRFFVGTQFQTDGAGAATSTVAQIIHA